METTCSICGGSLCIVINRGFGMIVRVSNMLIIFICMVLVVSSRMGRLSSEAVSDSKHSGVSTYSTS